MSQYGSGDQLEDPAPSPETLMKYPGYRKA